MSAAASARWKSVCDRLGVKPRQFAVLLTVTVVAVGALAAKTALKPSRAKAAAPAAAQAAAEPTAQPGVVAAAGAGQAKVVELTLEVRPARDPFRPFFLVADESTDAGQAPGRPAAASAPSASGPSGLPLRAIIAGEYAVIGEHTVGIGDEVIDGDGRRFVVEQILERRVVLREGARRAELGYSVAKPAAQKGARK